MADNGLHRVCPECGNRFLIDAASCRCGWRVDGSRLAVKGPVLCNWSDAGRPCQFVGIASFATQGGGPWYCREHFEVLQGRTTPGHGNELVPIRSSGAAREWHKAMAAHKAAIAEATLPRREPGEDAEERVA